jgi:hypothetical protein
VFSDIPNNRQMRWDEVTGEVSLFRAPSNFSNGNTCEGRQISFEILRHSARLASGPRYRSGRHGARPMAATVLRAGQASAAAPISRLEPTRR